MTGQKNRFSTTEKLWDLDDKQLKTPKHDALVLWFMDNWSKYISFEDELPHFRFNDEIMVFNTSEVKSEFPVMSSPTFLAGYVDIVIIGKYALTKEDWSRLKKTRVVKSSWCDTKIEHYIEVKPYIDSFGAVLRQINSYKRFKSDNGEWYLFTLDNRFDSHFESQGIKVLHPPADFDIVKVKKYYGLV